MNIKLGFGYGDFEVFKEEFQKGVVYMSLQFRGEIWSLVLVLGVFWYQVVFFEICFYFILELMAFYFFL